MENILCSSFQKIEFDSAYSLMKVQWINTEKLRAESYKNELIEQIKLIERFKPRHLFVDTSSFVFVIVPEIQEWNNINILTRVIKSGVRFVAAMIAPDLFAQVSIEQNMEEEVSEAINTKYFDNEPEAIAWLKKHI